MTFFLFLFPDLRYRSTHGRQEVGFRLELIPALPADQQMLFQRPGRMVMVVLRIQRSRVFSFEQHHKTLIVLP